MAPGEGVDRPRLLVAALAVVAVLPAAGALPADLGGAGLAAANQRIPRPPIVITDDSQFTPAHGVVRGQGTAENPYVIAGWEIDGGLWAPRQPVTPSSPFPPGIFIQGTDSHVVIRDNHVFDNPRSQIMIRDAEHVTIEDNVLERTSGAPRRAPFDDGITLVDVQDVTVRGNTVELSGSPRGANGIIAVSKVRDQRTLHDVTIRNNAVRNTGSFAGAFHGILVDGGSEVDVVGNTVENGGEVDVYQAVEARNLTDASVRANTALSPGPAAFSEGLHAARLHDTVVARNNFSGQDVGIRVVDSFDTVYRDNGLQDHADVAMALRGGHSPLLVGNRLLGSGLGLRLNRTTDLTARENRLDGNARGMSILGRSFSSYDHDIAPSNTVDGRPVRYLRGLSNATLDGDAMEAGYLALVAASNTVLNGTPDLPDNGQGLLVAGGRNVTVDAGTLEGHGTTLKVVQGRQHRIRNLTGTDARIVSSPLASVRNSSLEASDGHGLVVGPGSPGTFLRNLTLAGHEGAGLFVNRSGGTFADSLVLEHNDVGVRVLESTPVNVTGSSIANNDEAGLVARDAGGAWTVVNATHNWWGDADGPENFGGDGNPVVEGSGTDVVVDPVLTAPPDAGDPSPG